MDEPPGAITFLTERIDAVERERDALLEQSQRLELLQRSFVEIIAARDEAAARRAAMRGAWLGSGFTRALWFQHRGHARDRGALRTRRRRVSSNRSTAERSPKHRALYRITTGDSDIVNWMGGRRRCAALRHAPALRRSRRAPASGDAYLFYARRIERSGASTWSVNAMQRTRDCTPSFALERMRLAAELERLAMHDPLTGLFNRRALMERLEAELRTVRRTGEMLAFAMLDIDDFKAINDTRGHAGGDAALVTIAQILRTSTREIDTDRAFRRRRIFAHHAAHRSRIGHGGDGTHRGGAARKRPLGIDRRCIYHRYRSTRPH